MEEQDDKLIERYYLNDLSEAELVEFQRRMKEDEAFWEAVHLHADALEAIRLDGIALLRGRLKAKGKELDAQNPVKPARKWPWALLLLLLVGVPGYWLLRHTPQDNNTIPPLQNTPPEKPDDARPPASPPANAVRDQPAPKKDNDRQIFAAWFKPYRDESLEPSVRGNQPPSPSERFQQLYWEGDYRAALTAFDSLGATARNNDNLLFLKANCLLDAGQPEEAARILDAVVQNGRSRFSAEASWYLALSQIRAGRREAAQTLLRGIAADTRSPRKADAARLLQEWK